MEKFKFENLTVYQDAIGFVNDVYVITNKWSASEIYGLTSQFRRAATSIALNIAEGTSRTKKDFRHFLDLSRGSCYECVAISTIAKTRQFISKSEYEALYSDLNKVTRKISRLKSSIVIP